jgi:DNA replication protein DnaC
MDMSMLWDYVQKLRPLHGKKDDTMDERKLRLEARLAMIPVLIEEKVSDVRLRDATIEKLPESRREVARQSFRRSLYISGPAGHGKSWFSVACMRNALARRAASLTASEGEYALASRVDDLWGQGVAFAPFDDVIRRLQRGVATGEHHDILDKYSEPHWLVIDDVGARAGLSEFVASELASLVDRRYRSGSVTLYTSNLSLDELGGMLERAGRHVGQRTVSRIWGQIRGVGLAKDGGDLWPDAVPLELAGTDWRTP